MWRYLLETPFGTIQSYVISFISSIYFTISVFSSPHFFQASRNLIWFTWRSSWRDNNRSRRYFRFDSALSNSVELHLNGPCVIVDGHHLENPRFSDTGSIANRISRAFSLPFSPFPPPFFLLFWSLFVPSFRFIEQFSVSISPMTDRPFSFLRNSNIIRCHQFVFVSPLNDSGFTPTLTFSVLRRFLVQNGRSYQINGPLN